MNAARTAEALVRIAADARLPTRFGEYRVVGFKTADGEELGAVVRGVVDGREGVPVRLSSVAEVRAGQGPAEIRRIEGQRGIRIHARMSGTDLAAARDAVHLRERDAGLGGLFSSVNEMQRTVVLALASALTPQLSRDLQSEFALGGRGVARS